MVNLPESPTLHFLYLESELAYKNACMDLLLAYMNLSLLRELIRVFVRRLEALGLLGRWKVTIGLCKEQGVNEPFGLCCDRWAHRRDLRAHAELAMTQRALEMWLKPCLEDMQ